MSHPRGTKPADKFKQGETLEKSSVTGAFTHHVNTTSKIPSSHEDSNKAKFQSVWYRKFVGNDQKSRIKAELEVVSQELFRFFRPYTSNQPKTRLVVQSPTPGVAETDTFYVVSKEAKNTISLEELHNRDSKLILNKLIEQTDNRFKGLGEIMVLSSLLREADLKPANLKVDHQGNLIKIDGDACMLQLLYPNHVLFDSQPYPLIDTINKLPVPNHYVMNWMDAVQEGVGRINSSMLSATLAINKNFRDEINQTVLSISMMPEPMLRRFISHYVGDNERVNVITTELIVRRNQLLQSALNNPEFVEYMNSKAAMEHAAKFKLYMESFKLTGKQQLVNSDDEEKKHERRLATNQLGKIQLECESLSQKSSSDRDRRITKPPVDKMSEVLMRAAAKTNDVVGGNNPHMDEEERNSFKP